MPRFTPGIESTSSVLTIAKQLSCSRNTVRRYLRDGEACRYGPRLARPCKLDEYKAYLSERIVQAKPRWIPATVLLREIAERGYAGGISQLKAWLAPMGLTLPSKNPAPGQRRVQRVVLAYVRDLDRHMDEVAATTR